ncbi:MAG: aspartate 1-decarboxylase [Deltaproteobacteria bacterium GWA2_38_16]|nr:MAG: aspartate 1-decarboxylase [Deltaproteobacteria bacterium GWA2_38_16]OGQ02530.1 MAG: aspartate 1-decarboxylase [Deltaproteobacteria bacterium RIFCSPHIGHO2_02_FULL_38_15]OGQ32162.1 MAG: aspartate 1-decarboxylase [Deltaproteobacteria bacterium RIFCSPLOWO2_01_FULL_38_9]OGQ60251.1 MAG: aspartate 1-decarboxylase [Deltaproteobacteria bacterium RIFCSPLOWO2_12_FULL_38_8]HBQ21015.1 aspartate 1-decarboxylase [Deltaproteobacteria bacterium]
MYRQILKSKIHRMTVTDSNLNYEGSASIDSHLMEMADIVPFERIEIYNVTNGERFSTYAIPAAPLSGTLCINGAAARKASPGDIVIIASFSDLTLEEYKAFTPKVIKVNKENKILDSSLRSE